MGNWDQFLIKGSLGGTTIPKSRGIWSTPKRYIGHIGLDTHSGAYPKSKSDMYPIYPTMSVRTSGHFLPFSVFLARREPCSAPLCTPVAWTNGRYMLCCFCILVPMTHIPHECTDAYTHGNLAQGEHGQFCHFGTCGSNSGLPLAMAHKDLCEPSRSWPPLDYHCVSHRTLGPISKPPWGYTLGDTFIFGCFLGMPMHSFWDPSFSPPCGQLAAPYLCAHDEPGSNSRSYSLI